VADAGQVYITRETLAILEENRRKCRYLRVDGKENTSDATNGIYS
jgi:hypothetical protein